MLPLHIMTVQRIFDWCWTPANRYSVFDLHLVCLRLYRLQYKSKTETDDGRQMPQSSPGQGLWEVKMMQTTTPAPDGKTDWVFGCCIYALGSVIINFAQVSNLFERHIALVQGLQRNMRLIDTHARACARAHTHIHAHTRTPTHHHKHDLSHLTPTQPPNDKIRLRTTSK